MECFKFQSIWVKFSDLIADFGLSSTNHSFPTPIFAHTLVVSGIVPKPGMAGWPRSRPLPGTTPSLKKKLKDWLRRSEQCCNKNQDNLISICIYRHIMIHIGWIKLMPLGHFQHPQLKNAYGQVTQQGALATAAVAAAMSCREWGLVGGFFDPKTIENQYVDHGSELWYPAEQENDPLK